MNLTTYEICLNVRTCLFNTMAEVSAYHWSDESSMDEIRGVQNRIKNANWFKKVDPTDLTENEMRELGFGRWDNESTMMLLPLWLYPYLVDEIEVEDIFGKKEKYKTSEIDLDNRYGWLAFGVKPKETK